MALLFEERTKDQQQLFRYIAYSIIGLLISVLQATTLSFMAIGGIAPDLLIILCIWIAIWEGQYVGIFFGFALGLVFDFVTQDVIGSNALSKTIAAFIAGFFFKENMQKITIGSYKFIIISLLCAFIHNLIYFAFYLRPSEIPFFIFFIKYGIAATLYTTVFSIFATLSQIPFKR